jgi:hypothetical protein
MFLVAKTGTQLTDSLDTDVQGFLL